MSGDDFNVCVGMGYKIHEVGILSKKITYHPIFHIEVTDETTTSTLSTFFSGAKREQKDKTSPELMFYPIKTSSPEDILRNPFLFRAKYRFNFSGKDVSAATKQFLVENERRKLYIPHKNHFGPSEGSKNSFFWKMMCLSEDFNNSRHSPTGKRIVSLSSVSTPKTIKRVVMVSEYGKNTKIKSQMSLSETPMNNQEFIYEFLVAVGLVDPEFKEKNDYVSTRGGITSILNLLYITCDNSNYVS